MRFVENIPFYGFAVLCVDHPEVQALIPRVADRRIVTYGFCAPTPTCAPINLRLDRGGADFDVVVENRATDESRVIVDLRLPMFGQHNVQNALAAIAVAQEMGLPDDDDPPRVRALRRGQAALHQDRRGARHHRDRRLRPPSGRDRRRAARRARRPMAAPDG